MTIACLQIYRELLLLTTFLRVHSNSEEVSYLFWQNMYPNLKIMCCIKLKFFLWSKLLENLLLAKYITSVAVPLRWQVRSEKAKKGWTSSYYLKLPPTFISLSQSQLFWLFRFIFNLPNRKLGLFPTCQEKNLLK